MKLNYVRYVYPLEAGRETYEVTNPKNSADTKPIVIKSFREFREFQEHLTTVFPKVEFVHTKDSILGKEYKVN